MHVLERSYGAEVLRSSLASASAFWRSASALQERKATEMPLLRRSCARTVQNRRLHRVHGREQLFGRARGNERLIQSDALWSPARTEVAPALRAKQRRDRTPSAGRSILYQRQEGLTGPPEDRPRDLDERNALFLETSRLGCGVPQRVSLSCRWY